MTAAFIPPVIGDSLSEILIPDVQTTINLFGMHLRRVSGEWNYPVHEHPQYEINYLLEGTQLMNIEGKELLQQAGDLFLIRPGHSHSSSSGSGDPFTYFCIHFDIDDSIFLSLLNQMKQELFTGSSQVVQHIQPSLDRVIEMARQSAEANIPQRMLLQSAIFELFGMLWESVSKEAGTLYAGDYHKIELGHSIRNRLFGLVNQSFSEGTAADNHYGIDDIAKELGISPSYCNRIFRQIFGLSPRAYLSSLVLHKAKLLLAGRQMSVQQVSSVLGYRDVAHFSRQFKRWTGLSPSEYRHASEQERS